MSEELAVELKSATMDFPILRTGPAFLKELLTGRFSLKDSAPTSFRALDSVDVQVSKGEVLGIMGPNGAGKSTMLRVIAGIYAPDEGVVRTRGRIALLAGLGAGFQKDLTGRENIYLSGSVYGFGEDELYDLVPSIVVFSGIGSFIDKPLRTYSSGMRARLAFSLASHLNPDILLIDEVLAVGDSDFRQKSKDRIQEMVKGDATVIIVSHNEPTLRDMCDRAICLHEGKVDICSTDINEVIERYHLLSKSSKK